MTSDARQKCGNLRYAITYVIWTNQKTESFESHWLRALAMFDVTIFPAILSCIRHHFKFCRYVNLQAVPLRSDKPCQNEPLLICVKLHHVRGLELALDPVRLLAVVDEHELHANVVTVDVLKMAA